MQMDLFEKACILAKFRCFVMQMGERHISGIKPLILSFFNQISSVLKERGIIGLTRQKLRKLLKHWKTPIVFAQFSKQATFELNFYTHKKKVT